MCRELSSTRSKEEIDAVFSDGQTLKRKNSDAIDENIVDPKKARVSADNSTNPNNVRDAPFKFVYEDSSIGHKKVFALAQFHKLNDCSGGAGCFCFNRKSYGAGTKQSFVGAFG